MRHTAGDIVVSATRRLDAAGIDTARQDARILIAHVLNQTPGWLTLHADYALTDSDVAEAEALIARRETREPVSHIIGTWEFWGLPMIVTPDVLTPRPDTETVVEAVLDIVPDKAAPLRVLDLGTGTGCLLLALLHELKAATGVGVDRSRSALAVAQANADALHLADRVSLREGNWFEGLEARFDIVVSNPPYIAEDEKADLMPEVAEHEPAGALFAGADGLDDYRRLVPRLPDFLRPDGVAAFEVGRGQADAVATLLREAGLGDVTVVNDLSGIARCVRAKG